MIHAIPAMRSWSPTKTPITMPLTGMPDQIQKPSTMLMMPEDDHPHPAAGLTIHERGDDAEDPVGDEHRADDDRQGDRSRQWVGDDVEADDDEEDPEEALQQAPPDPRIRREDADDVGDAGDDQQPADDDRGHQGRVDRVVQRDEPEDEQHDAERDEPAAAASCVGVWG